MTISVAIATHNEEGNIKRTLKSVYSWVDEIVIVDGASTDKTIEVINQLEKTLLRQGSGRASKIKIIQTDNPQIFHINKQKALEKCKGDWILQLDADEVVSKELKREIQNSITKTSGVVTGLPGGGGLVPRSPKDEVVIDSPGVAETKFEKKRQPNVAFWIPRLNFFLGRPLRKGGLYPDYTIRLYKNGVAHFPCRTVHEQVEVRRTDILSEAKDPNEIAASSSTPSNDKKTGNGIGYLQAPLLHYPYPTFKEYLIKWHRYVALEAELLRKKGVRPSVVNFIKYVFVEPIKWFLLTYFRHKGFMDGLAGFVFSLFSALRFPMIYKNLRMSKNRTREQNSQ
ncbi:MAG: glycosyltransferase family 2 protein [Candidatus Paceibacterota bacterium]